MAAAAKPEVGQPQRNEHGERPEEQGGQRDEPEPAEEAPVVERAPQGRDRLSGALRRCGHEEGGDGHADRHDADRAEHRAGAEH